VLAKLQSPTLEKALTFLDDKALAATSNAVERANRRHRKMQKSIYRVRTWASLTARIAMDLYRDRNLEASVLMRARLHSARQLTVGNLGL